MESEKHKASRYKDGGIHSDNCKCGRPWYARWNSGGIHAGYVRVCPGCRKKTKDCICEPLKHEKEKKEKM